MDVYQQFYFSDQKFKFYWKKKQKVEIKKNCPPTITYNLSPLILCGWTDNNNKCKLIIIISWMWTIIINRQVNKYIRET